MIAIVMKINENGWNKKSMLTTLTVLYIFLNLQKKHSKFTVNTMEDCISSSEKFKCFLMCSYIIFFYCPLFVKAFELHEKNVL